MCRTRPPFAAREVALEAGVITATPGKDNITNPAAFASAVQGLIPSSGKRRTAALLIPDNSVRMALLEFEKLPDKEEERRALDAEFVLIKLGRFIQHEIGEVRSLLLQEIEDFFLGIELVIGTIDIIRK